MMGKTKIITAAVLFVFMVIVIDVIYQPTGQIIDQWYIKNLENSNPTRKVTLPYVENIPKPSVYEFSTIIYPDNINSDAINIRRINGYAFEVIFNDQIIYSKGNMNTPTANLWNHSFLINIPPGLLDKENDLIIRTYGLHDIGFIMEPTLGMASDYYLKVELQNLLSNGISSMVGGAAFIVGILLILIGRSQKKRINYYIQLGMASILASIYSFEYTYREYTSSINVYLWIRKLLLISIILSLGFMAKSLYKFIYNRDLSKKIWYSFSLSLIGILIMPNYHMLQLSMNYYNVINIVILCFIIFIVFKGDNKKLYFSVTFLALTTAHSIIIIIFSIPKLMLLNYGISVMLFGVIYNVVTDFGQLHIENEELDMKTLTDPLTGAYNRTFLTRVSNKEYSIVIFIDLDHFKQYNDTRGHHQGDQLLQGLVKIIQRVIDKNSVVIRYGGDEFVICLKNITMDIAKIKINQIQDF